MLTIQGPRQRLCDGISRRAFLTIGGFVMGSVRFGLADILRADDRRGAGASHKAVINVFLGGGPPHQDMWEIKTEAPAEIRGEFRPIATRVPGVAIGECFPRIAASMHRFAALRAVVGSEGRHDAFQCMTGWTTRDMAAMGGRPSLGAALMKVEGPVDPSVPAFVGLAAKTQHVPWSDPGKPGFLGPAYAPFQPDGPGLENLTLRGVSTAHLADRRRLLLSFDRLKGSLDALGTMTAFDASTARALDVLTSSKLLDALDISKEDGRVRDRYGDGKPYQFQYDGAPTCNDQLLMARRLVEAGVRCVTLTFGRWDSHGKNFDLVRDHGSKLDQCLSALVEDLETRGMLDDVTVIAWGEFGRTPKINNNAGRDHWPPVSCALLAGGGMHTGQAIGSTNRLGEHAVDRPVHFQEIYATIYHNLGLAPMHTTIVDPSGRPQFLVDAREPISELV